MKASEILKILVLVICTSIFISCQKEEGRKITGYEEYTITVASKKVPGLLFASGDNHISEVYAVMKEHSAKWEQLGNIQGFEYEPGYEYTMRISETSYLDRSMGDPAWTEYELLKLISKEEKTSDEVPDNFIPDWFYTEYCSSIGTDFRYYIDAENKDIIEEDLNSNPIITFGGLNCYMDNNWTRWLLVNEKKEIDMLGYIKKVNKEGINFPESYNNLKPKGTIVGTMEWTFIIGNDPENEDNAIKYDVFICNPSKNKSAGPTSVPSFYKDFTHYYQEKYPEAGVRAVAINHNLK
ncbi:DUF4377 domain-containing protein [uncultured Bacteroides sp.]|uniref:DUF4377 domain-containing protein n=1 Tax=uncultured Bacteroides sp. TaxID=162156 RepID=UPI00261D0EA4|nr:DUF4377 domain-containing protein [uncultured Bacteroides sp.]